MTLPASSAISFSQVNTELGRSSTAQLSLNCSAVRTLFGDASGAVSMNDGHGKSNAAYLCISTSGACVNTCYACSKYKVATWRGSGSFTVNRVGSGVGNAGSHINYVVVSGGGSGAGKAVSGGNPGTSGGGGGGGILNDCSNICSSGGVSVSARTYTVTVGAGGSATSYSSCGAGHNSSICCLISTTGGGAGQSIERGYCYRNGGSGGGASPISASSRGTGISGQGYAGGYGCYQHCSCCSYQPWIYLGGGGGGAGSVGGNAVYNTRGGNGGSGRFVSITCHTYSGGGGGGTGFWRVGGTHHGQSTGGGPGGAGATDCCGAKVYNSGYGGVNSGGGGGGSGMFNGNNCTYFYGTSYGSNGGSGIVAIRWRFQ